MAQPPQWMPMPQADPNCPKGLEYLTQVDQLIVQQKVELLEAFTGFETQNKYAIQNTVGQQVYFAAEKSGCCERQCCGNARSFEMQILDNQQQEVLTLKRPLRFGALSCCLCSDCRQHMTVMSGSTIIGHVKADCACVIPSFTILSADMEPVLYVKGPCCGFGCSCQPKFSVKATNGEEIGVIQKKWSGLAKEAFTDADNFGITFPMDLDVKYKASLLGALFLIDFEFFETKSDPAGDNGGVAAGECLCALCLMG